jgi:3-oxoacyl-[acyl-carrier protein] reductase
MRFENKVVVITGAASGFGRAAVHKFAGEGARIAAADINADGLNALVAEVSSQGAAIIGVETDVTKAASVQGMTDAAVKAFGTIDVLVNNAGAGHPPMFMHEMPEEQFDQIFALNTKSVYLGVKAVTPVMIENGGGVIINTASIGAKNPRLKSTPYNSAKAAVVVMTRGLAVDLARFKIRVNCVCPLAAETGFFKTVTGQDRLSDEARKKLESDVPLRRLTQPEDVANAMAYLASGEAGFITGVSLDIDGGKSI